MKPGSKTFKTIPWDIVGSNKFGRTPKISSEQTFNMIQADGFLVDWAGYSKIQELNPTYKGRGNYTSVRANLMFEVIGNAIFITDSNLFTHQIAQIDTFSGKVFIVENDTSQVVFSDKKKLYVYNYSQDLFTIPDIPEGTLPGYITFQDGRIIMPDLLSNRFYLSNVGDANNWHWGASGETVFEELSTKASLCTACVAFEGRGTLMAVLGNNVGELFTDVGTPAESPYKRNSSISINTGTLSLDTVAIEDSILMWLGGNTKYGATLMVSKGANATPVGNDGFNYKLTGLSHPEQSEAFFIRLGDNKKLFYQITFYHPDDNLTYLYDTTSDEYYTLTDELSNYHIARNVTYFNNKSYFISFKDGCLYEISPRITIYDYGKFPNGSPWVYSIPRGRICKNVRDDNGDAFVINDGSFTIESGDDPHYPELSHPNYVPHVDLSVSVDGGQVFSSFQKLPVKFEGHRISRPIVWGLGYTNDFVSQFRFWSYGRLVVTNGALNIYK